MFWFLNYNTFGQCGYNITNKLNYLI
jgi:hypothetical protein